MMDMVHTDGGRTAAGFTGLTGDCVTRAIAIATDVPYGEVYKTLAGLAKARGEKTPRNGVARKIYEPYLLSQGWEWVPTMKVGSGCKVHLRADELPSGRLIVRVSGHLVAVMDGVIHDSYDPSREGTRCVYGYFKKP